uniref:Putative ovule protein n=1 Tax=Solanum chacoense TaxID=4108 RepID=A0A0V0GZT3_SOLCH
MPHLLYFELNLLYLPTWTLLLKSATFSFFPLHIHGRTLYSYNRPRTIASQPFASSILPQCVNIFSILLQLVLINSCSLMLDLFLVESP